ncbi:MAG: hypothetical protein AABW73_01775 [Nanoarchaeota archaeon]
MEQRERYDLTNIRVTAGEDGIIWTDARREKNRRDLEILANAQIEEKDSRRLAKLAIFIGTMSMMGASLYGILNYIHSQGYNL